MNIQSLPVIIMASITVYSGLYHLLVYFMRRKRLLDLAFAIVNLTIAFYDIFCALLYNVNSPEAGVVWQRAQVVTLAFASLAIVWFVLIYTEHKKKRHFYFLFAYFTLAVIVGIFDRTNLTWTNIPAVKVAHLPFDWTVTYYEMTPGPLTDLQSFMGWVAYIYSFAVAVQYFRRGNRERATPLIWALVVLFIAIINDTMVSSGFYQFIYTIEYAYAGMIIMMTFSLSRDVVRARSAEEALERSESKFRALTERMTQIIIIIDKNGGYKYISPSIRYMLGYTPDDFTKVSLDLIVHPDDLGIVKNTISEASSESHKTIRVDSYRIRHFDGSWLYFEGLFTNMLDVPGVEGIVINSRDITDRKKAEDELSEYREHLEDLVKERTEELRLAQIELLKQEKLATLGKLVAIVSHELRNPLGTITNSLTMIKENLMDKVPEVKPSIDRAERNIVRCVNIIEELLYFSRARTPIFTITPLDEWLKEVIKEQIVPEKIKLITELHSGVYVSIDKEQMRRCIINLITNAVQAIEGKKFTSASADDLNEITIRDQIIGSNFEIVITDTGTGISQDNMEKIFEPLFSTKSFGIGLGLTIVKQIMEEHNGQILVRSELYKGTKVTLSLPLSQT